MAVPGEHLVNVRGQLAEGVLPEVLRHVAYLHSSGRLMVENATHRGTLCFRAGRPVHAACRMPDGSVAHGPQAVAAMLRWREGSYRFQAGVAIDGSTLSGTVEDVLQAAGAPSGVPSRVPSALPPAVPPGAPSAVQPGAPSAVPSSAPASAPVRPVARPAVRPAPNGHPRLGRERDEADAAKAAPVDSFEDGPLVAVTSGPESPDPFELASGIAEAFGPGDREAPAAMAVLERHVDPGDPAAVTLSRRALALWLELDGRSTLAAIAERSGSSPAQARALALELTALGLVRVVASGDLGEDFVQALERIANDIMGPMGEIVVDEALEALALDRACISADRVSELVARVGAELERSDWQIKLQARIGRWLSDAYPHVKQMLDRQEPSARGRTGSLAP